MSDFSKNLLFELWLKVSSNHGREVSLGGLLGQDPPGLREGEQPPVSLLLSLGQLASLVQVRHSPLHRLSVWRPGGNFHGFVEEIIQLDCKENCFIKILNYLGLNIWTYWLECQLSARARGGHFPRWWGPSGSRQQSWWWECASPGSPCLQSPGSLSALWPPWW